jgi:alpha-L-rhamnosidase
MKYIFTVFCYALFSLGWARVCSASTGNSGIESSFIWCQAQAGENGGYVVFRKSFDLDEYPATAQVQIFADSRYLLWINGKYVLRGPCRFNPKRPEYDVVDVHDFIQEGSNNISVLVHDYGNAINGRIMKHDPGLALMLEVSGREILRTDTTWRYSNETMYLPAPASWNTVPDIMDARIENGGWKDPGFDDSGWPFASPVDGNLWGTMVERDIPLARETELTGLRRLPSGELLNNELPIELDAGQEILIDFGRMAMAYTVMELDAEEGSEITMRYALRYKDGKPSEMFGVGNRYIAREGRQSFMTTDQWCSHYMQVSCVSGKVRLQGLKIIDRRYPFDRIGTFSCSDEMITTLWEMAQNTIEVTSDDAYGSDARERNEWIQDAFRASFPTTRVASSGPGRHGEPIYSDPRLLKNMLRHAALSQLPDGRMPATFPTDRGPEDCHYVIDDYSFQWFEGLLTYYHATADIDFVREMWTNAAALAEWYLSQLTSNGLLLAREYTSFDNPLAYITCEGATINAFFYSALKISGELAQILGKTGEAAFFVKTASDLREAFNSKLWNDREMAYNAAIYQNRNLNPTAHAQLIALHYGLVPTDRIWHARQWFLTNYRNPGMKHVCNNAGFEMMINMKAGVNMPIVYNWLFDELYRMDTAEHDKEVLDEIRRRWSSMVWLQKDAGTLSESFTNEKGEGSHESCHNYGSTPAYFLSSFVLGVRRNSSVTMKKLIVEPRLGDLTWADGIVVTEFGPVPVSWKKSDDGLRLHFSITMPDGIQAEIRLPAFSDHDTLVINDENNQPQGNIVNFTKSRGRWLVADNVTGVFAGHIQSGQY